MLPRCHLLPQREHLLLPPAVAQTLNWDEKKLRKPAERQLRGNQREVQSKEPQIDTVGDKEWVWGRKLKEKEKGGGRKCTLYSPPQYLLFPFLLVSVFFFSASHFSLPCWSSPSSLHVPPHPGLFSFTSNNPQLCIWSCFGTTVLFFWHTHTHAQAETREVSQAGAMKRVRRRWRGSGRVILRATCHPGTAQACVGLWVQQETG